MMRQEAAKIHFHDLALLKTLHLYRKLSVERTAIIEKSHNQLDCVRHIPLLNLVLQATK
jgi:hypothetical protein